MKRETEKNSYRRVLSNFLQTTFGRQLMKERGKIEQQFNKLKDQGWNSLVGMDKIVIYCMFS
jgi:hypothetical protein